MALAPNRTMGMAVMPPMTARVVRPPSTFSTETDSTFASAIETWEPR